MSLMIQLFLAAFIVSFQAFGQSGAVHIPLNTFMKPASNLVTDQAKEVSFGQAAKMYKQGVDLSKLSPIEDKYWQNKKYSAVDTASQNEMAKYDEVDYVQLNGSSAQLGLATYIVAPTKASDQRYVLGLGLQVHTSLLRAGLLRKLGFFQNSPKHYKKIKMNFASAEARKQFIIDTFCAADDETVTDSCLTLSPYKTAESPRQFISDEGDKSLIIYGAYMYKMDPEVPVLFDGLTPAVGEITRLYSSSRQFRSLLSPFVIADLGESLMSPSGQVAFVRDGYALINYAFPQYFGETSDVDMKWILRRVGALTEQDWDDIVEGASYPQCYKQRAKALVMLRSQNLINTFFNRDEAESLFTARIPDLNYDCADMVKEGRILNQYLPDYPQRFFYGESPALWGFGDLIRYVNVRGMSAGIGVAIDKLSKELDLQQSKIKTDQASISGFRMGPDGRPQAVGHVPTFNYGLNLGASRFVTTGTFYGSDAAVQLVDNVSVGVGIGYGYIILDKVGGVGNPMAGLNTNIDFTHVRPLQSMKETKEVPWKDLFVPSKLKEITSPLEKADLSAFFQNFAVGEVFTMTVSVGGGANYGWSYGLDNLIGFTGSHVPTLGFMAGMNKVTMGQIQINRTQKGFQVFVRKQNTKAFNATMDFNYFINLLKIKNDTVSTQLHTDAFVLNYNNDYVVQLEKTIQQVKDDAAKNGEDADAAVTKYYEENPEIEKDYKSKKDFGNRITGAFKELFYHLSARKLYENFPKQVFNIDHGLKTNEVKTKLLWWRWSKMNEEHLFKFIKPQLVAVTDGEVENKPIEVVTYKKGAMSGRDLFGFGLGVVDAALKEKFKEYAPVFAQDSQNPSQMPYGRAQWHTVRTDLELTDREGRLQPVAVLQNVWGGWSLKKDELDKILNKVRERFKGTEFESKDLIPAETYSQVKKLDFFRITENLSLVPSGLEKLRTMIIEPDATGIELDKAKFMDKMIQKMSQWGSNNKARPQDKAIFRNLMTIIGAGDEEVGKKFYIAECKKRVEQQSRAHMEKHHHVNYVSWSKGTRYECLEPWVDNIIEKSREFVRSSPRDQTRVMTELIYELEQNIPLYVLLKALGQENYIYFVEVTGFKVGAEINEQGVYVSNVLGEPRNKHPYANGLLSYIAEKLGLLPLEVDRSQVSFQ